MFNSTTIKIPNEDLVIDKFVGIMLTEFIEEVTLLQMDNALIPYDHSICCVLNGSNGIKNEKDSYLFMRNEHKPPEKVQSFI